MIVEKRVRKKQEKKKRKEKKRNTLRVEIIRPSQMKRRMKNIAEWKNN